MSEEKEWKRLWAFLRYRFCEGWRNPAYVLYFVVIVIFMTLLQPISDFLEDRNAVRGGGGTRCSNAVDPRIPCLEFFGDLFQIALLLMFISGVEFVLHQKKSGRTNRSSQDYSHDEAETELNKLHPKETEPVPASNSIRMLGVSGMLMVLFIYWVSKYFIAIPHLYAALSLLVYFAALSLWFISNSTTSSTFSANQENESRPASIASPVPLEPITREYKT